MKTKILFFLLLAAATLGLSACTAPSADSNADKSLQEQESAAINEAASSASANELAAATTDSRASTTGQTTASTTTNQIASPAPAANLTNMPSPEQQTDLLKTYSQAIIKTNFGNIQVKFYNTGAPLAVNNFMNLAKAGFYNGVKFHRVIKDFMIQGGDPNSKGSDTSIYGQGGPGYQFKNEDSGHKLVTGSLAMANAGPDTNGSQFFIVTALSTPWLDGSYSNFGEVVSGMEAVRKIENLPVNGSDRPLSDAVISSIELLK